ncbi:intracellular protein transport [Venturia nashicola]|uniref:Intracellular protein transport n=1 Tax=Venturia nashicola TaxID=86259 RepID=A0A4Z1NQY9_9PEZI|nr:intracellular protein transport [Venturia nashicola]
MVIKRFSNMLGSKKGKNPFTRNGGGGSSSDTARRASGDYRGSNSEELEPPLREGTDTPEGNAARGVRLFCESGGSGGEEVLHLPTIVEAAESSPQAAQVAAKQIRKFLSKENNERPHVQYNAIMLIRILADNPGPTFTRNLDAKFTSTVKELLRNGRDPSVQQILRETLATLYTDKAYDSNLTTLFTMWNKEQGATSPRPQNGASAWPVPAAGGFGNNSNNQQQSSRTQPRSQHVPEQENYGRNQREHGLPPPAELAARIEEAKTSAKLLQQLVQSTPPNEIQDNDLIKEFSERCQTAQRSVQGYINSTDPPPDDDTMQTLIETSEQLSLAASKHQRAVLQARRAVASVSPPAQNAYAPPVGAPTGPSMAMGQNTGYSSSTSPPSSTFVPNVALQESAYSPPPVPPPSMRANHDRRQSDHEVPSSQSAGTSSPPAMAPPSSRAPQLSAPARPAPLELPTPQYDNPFSDRHESHPQPSASAYSISDNPRPLSRITEPQTPSNRSEYDEYDDPYHAPTPTQSTLATVGARPAPRQQDTVENWRREIDTSSPPRREGESYHPGYQSTPSYMQRQESSEAHLTMHGGAIPPTPTPGLDTEKELGNLNQMNLSPVKEIRSTSGSFVPADRM